MTTQKDFKRVVRARMQKTGESYTAARANLLRKTGHAPASRRAPVRDESPSAAQAAAGPAPVVLANPPAAEFAKIAGRSDAIMKERTGCTWDAWVAALDYARAHEWEHREIAQHVVEKYKLSGWWAQAVTVGYERIRGLRGVGQRRSGSWKASKSKTIAAPIATVYRTIRDARARRTWLPDVKAEVRSVLENKTVRFNWPDGTRVEAYLTAKEKGKTIVAITHLKLTSRQAVDERKAYWGDRLAALAGVVARKS